MESPRWNIITPSQYAWERRALDFIRLGLPDYDPYRAWTNFEFQTADGAIYEVDLLVLTKQGFWLIECKGWQPRRNALVAFCRVATTAQGSLAKGRRNRRTTGSTRLR